MRMRVKVLIFVWFFGLVAVAVLMDERLVKGQPGVDKPFDPNPKIVGNGLDPKSHPNIFDQAKFPNDSGVRRFVQAGHMPKLDTKINKSKKAERTYVGWLSVGQVFEYPKGVVSLVVIPPKDVARTLTTVWCLDLQDNFIYSMDAETEVWPVKSARLNIELYDEG